MNRIAAGVIVGTLVLVPPINARAQAAPCAPLCEVMCIRPISIPDRWDDATAIPGYAGEPGRPNWSLNGFLDREAWSDTNENFTWDPGEPYIDGNANGVHDAEIYEPAMTGYTAHEYVGLEVILHPSTAMPAELHAQYLAVGLPPLNKGTPATGGPAFRARWNECEGTLVGNGDRLRAEAGALISVQNQIWRDLMALDPDASWDSLTGQVVGSAFASSPRIFLMTAFDPRSPITSGHVPELVVRKVIAVFAERMVGTAEVRARFIQVQATGTACNSAELGGFAVECPVPATPATWGRVKDTYR